MTKTENYQLNQWDAADPIRREDFNSDNAALDAAIKEVQESQQGLRSQVESVSAANCLVKLGEVSGETATSIMTLDFSGIDLSRYERIEIYLSGMAGSDQLFGHINNDTGSSYGSSLNATTKVTQLSLGGMSTLSNGGGSYHISLTSAGGFLAVISDWICGYGNSGGLQSGHYFGRWWNGNFQDMQNMQIFSSNSANLSAGYHGRIYGILG